MNSIMSVVIRGARSADLGTVQEISAEAYTPAYMAVIGVIPKPATEDYRPRIGRGEVWILEAEAEPVGLIVLETRPDHLVIYSIAVRPAQQGQGHGRRLLQFAERQAATHNVRELRLYTNIRMDRNIALYRHCGFIVKGARPHPSRVGEALVDMVKQIPTPPASF
jgi:ribosomal protein S18 acetylase RimI-like enzyme